MSNFELPSHTPNFDLTWQQWLARQANLLTIDSTNTVSNKTINLSDNTLTGTTAQFNAALSDSNFLTDASIGVTVQAWDANLDQIAALSPTDNNFIVGNGNSWALETPSDARTSLGLGTMATQDATNVNIDGGTIDGVTIGGDDPVTLFVDEITVEDTSTNIPQLIFTATDAALNSKSWRWRVTGLGLQLDAISDSGATSRTAIALTKDSSQNIDSISMGQSGNTLLTLNASTLDINADAIDIDGGSAASASITGDISSITLTVSGSFTVNGSNVLTASGIGSTVQAWDADLDTISGLAKTSGNVITANGSAWTSAPVEGRYIQTQILTSGTSFTTSASTNRIRYRMAGGGGGGGGGDTAASSCGIGGGGGAGAEAEGWFDVDPSTSYSYAIGALGAGGAAGDNDGSSGGNTTLTVGATTVTCPGGGGGGSMAAGTSVTSIFGGAGGAIATNGDINMEGRGGQYGIRFSGTEGVSGAGAQGSFSSGGRARVVSGDGIDATGYGGGGGGGLSENGATAAAGGDGSPGIIVIDEYS